MKGYLKNLEFERIHNMLYLRKGSLSTYYFGNNFETLTLSQTKEVIESMSDNLHIDLNLSDITRIDFASNIITVEPPQNYFTCLTEASRLNRNLRNSTLYFSNNKKSLVFYDKVKHYQNINKYIPKPYTDLNVLRYERRSLKLNRLKYLGKDLYNSNYFNQFLLNWKKDYEGIKKHIPLKFRKEASEEINMSDLDKYRWKLLLKEAGGIQNLNTILDNAQREGRLKRQNKYYLKKKIIEAVNSPDLLEENNLVTELNEKINQAYNSYAV
ncbi:hypothetical protein [Clostridium sp.]|uniref:hypothetical protein n=1 Tax=Clostridium sp. TaxID=1506 RepID=UPI00283BA31A|nr:hypothetical protein [Clostridium sp.]MDR3594275.1 hypothetical protein [Clostridium sp.]